MKRWQALKLWKKIALVTGAGLFTLIALGIIFGSNSGTTTATRTVTTTVTVTKASKPIVKTPPSCIGALGLMQQALALVNSAAGIYVQQIAPAARAGIAGDAAALNRATANMNRATAKINAATPLVLRATPLASACKASR